MSKRKNLGFVDRMLEKLPKIHIKGYNYCGPNTNLDASLAYGELGINELDNACMMHDIAYAESEDLKFRCEADKLLILKAIRRVHAKDSRIGERFAALLVSCLITIKLIFSKMELRIRRLQSSLASKSKHCEKKNV